MKLPKKPLVKIVSGVILGGAAGFGLSYLWGYLGSSCPLMCNPVPASVIGMLAGVMIAIGD